MTLSLFIASVLLFVAVADNHSFSTLVLVGSKCTTYLSWSSLVYAFATVALLWGGLFAEDGSRDVVPIEDCC